MNYGLNRFLIRIIYIRKANIIVKGVGVVKMETYKLRSLSKEELIYEYQKMSSKLRCYKARLQRIKLLSDESY